ncbi:LytR/AlgR family response regulator transcription factor [Saccharophagus degradans]|uniref:Response regulator receiver n=1 Tax=Saccharophagus degradans (strain 2-40 / ATCC 43961 / DSM 17024) TaxID=203122 RepID=Q21DS4_SACD2|nr:LytTR family DNA-binding domain-containing protein [Saccharophagus degradans]ABD83155.1 response regulator receiver [Saccharophagus degradans 2-40]
MPINAIIVDDEAHARQALQHLLGTYKEINIIAQCENGKTAVKAVHELEPQVMFLDIHMPKLDGFEVLELLGDAAPITVFITAHDDYAIQAFENNALDYLLKPVSEERLARTVERICQRIKEANLTAQPNPEGEQSQRTTDVVQNYIQRQAPIGRVLVRDKGDVHVISTTNIIAIEAADDYVVIHVPGGTHIKQERLSRLEELLDPQQFCRIHRSTIINLDYLQGIETEGKDTRFANLKTPEGEQKQFAISRGGYGKLIEVL